MFSSYKHDGENFGIVFFSKIKSMKKTFTFITMMFLCALLSAQPVSVTFSGRLAENEEYLPLSYVVVQNQSRGWKEVLVWPDTVLMMTDVTGIQERPNTDLFALYQNTPNPFRGTTDVQLSVAEPGSVAVEIFDIFGRIVAAKTIMLSQPGIHQLRVNLSSTGTYLMTVRQKGLVSSIKMIASGGNSRGDGVEYVGASERQGSFSEQTKKAESKGAGQHSYLPGDVMIYEGYALNSNNQMIYSTPVQQTIGNTSQNVTLEFATTDVLSYQPCPGMPSVMDHQGNVYTTVLIGNQCWTRENMRCTTSPKGYLHYGGNQVSYFKPYFYDDPLSVIPFVDRGLLYNWAGAMDTTSTALITTSFTGRRGICPQGWHVPSKDEMDTLLNYMSGQSGYLCNSDSSSFAKALASTNYWISDSIACHVGNDVTTNNATGFTAIPTGFYDAYLTSVVYTGHDATFWSSTLLMDVGYSSWGWGVHRNWAKPDTGCPSNDSGISVRCLRD